MILRTQRQLKVWEIALGIGLAAALLSGAGAMRTQTELSDKVVRLHILANSDREEDQRLKLLVRDAILERTEETLKDSENRADAYEKLQQALPELQQLARETIVRAGYDYSVAMELKDTAFPTRQYEGFSLPSGMYLALRVIIGAGDGQNWWCVVFPPLCTAASSQVSVSAMTAGLTQEEIRLITEENQGYVLKFKTIELWESVRAYVERWMAES